MDKTNAKDSYDVLVVGAGIAGSTLAALLAPHCRLALVDRDVRGLHGSTGHAPGVVAQINSVPALTELARRSVAAYRRIPGGFDTVGGMEVAFGAAGADWLRAREAIAVARKLEHRVLCPVEAQTLSPLVRDDAEGAIFFPHDGTANARVIAHANQDAAAALGADLIDGDAIALHPCAAGYVLVLASGRFLTARRIVVATGIWSPQLVPDLTTTAVTFAHPYTFSARRPKRDAMPPFIRFPNELVYVRDHGERDGLGTYATDPITVRAALVQRLPTAYAPWIPAFDAGIRKALGVLPDEVAATFGGRGPNRPVDTVRGQPGSIARLAGQDRQHVLAGMFTITPDGLPLVGRLAPGVYTAVGCWVTQAGGAMGVLADQILADMGVREAVGEDRWLRDALDPRRFDEYGEEQREDSARETYRDIWNKKTQDAVVKRQQMREFESVLSKL